MRKTEFPKTRVERLAPALDGALLAVSLFALWGALLSTALGERLRAARAGVECSAEFRCEIRLTLPVAGLRR